MMQATSSKYIIVVMPLENYKEDPDIVVVEGVKETTNPFERDKNKEGIEKRLKERGLDASGIKFNENYDDGSYTGGKIKINQ